MTNAKDTRPAPAMTQKLPPPDEKLVPYDSLDDLPAAPPLSEAFKAQHVLIELAREIWTAGISGNSA